MCFGSFRQSADALRHIGVLAGKDETEVTFRQLQSKVARKRAEHRNADSGGRVGCHYSMPCAGDPIEEYAGNFDRGIVGRKSARQRRNRLRLARNVDHQQHRQVEVRGEISGRAAVAARGGCWVSAIEQSHDAFNEKDIRVICRLRHEPVEQIWRHRPGIEIDAWPAGDR